MTENGSNDQTTNQQDSTIVPPADAIAFNNQFTDLTGFPHAVFQFQPLQSGVFQQLPYSGTCQQGQPMQFQCNSLFCLQPTSTPLKLNDNPGGVAWMNHCEPVAYDNNPIEGTFDIDTPPASHPIDSVGTDASQSVPPSPDTLDSMPLSAESLQSVAPSAISSSLGNMNKRQRFMETQSEGAENIYAAILTFLQNAEERARRSDEAKFERYEALRIRLEEEHCLRKEKHCLRKEEHVLKMACMRTTLVKDLKYVSGELQNAYTQLEQIDPSSLTTRHEQFHYTATKEMVEILEPHCAGLKKLLASVCVETPEP